MKITVAILITLNLITFIIMLVAKRRNKETVQEYRNLIGSTATALELYVVNDKDKDDRLGKHTALETVMTQIRSAFHQIEDHLPPQIITLSSALGKWKEDRGYGFKRVKQTS